MSHLPDEEIDKLGYALEQKAIGAAQERREIIEELRAWSACWSGFSHRYLGAMRDAIARIEQRSQGEK